MMTLDKAKFRGLDELLEQLVLVQKSAPKRAVVYVHDEHGNTFNVVEFERDTLTDGSHVYGVTLRTV